MKARILAAVLALGTGLASWGQGAQPTPFKDTSMLKPPAGAKVAVVEFEDLECPACSLAYPIVHRAVQQYNIPLVRYDFPLKMHVWSFDAAVYARYMQEKISPNVADQYRGAVFANQMSISSKDDLQRATRKFLADRGQQLPFTVDANGELAKKVHADYAVGERLNLVHTPTIIVVTQNHYEEVVGDTNQIFGMIEAAKAQANAAPAAKKVVAKKK